jgi:uncharacterized protein DUF6544
MLSWLIGLILVAAALGAVASANRRIFERRVAAEVDRLWAGTAEPRPVARDRLDPPPAPVRRYLSRALGHRDRSVRTLRLGHGGTFRTALDGAWMPIRGEQYFATDPPAFIWHGRVRIGPGLWVDARDRSVGGVGSMLVRAESTFTIADRSGPELDQGALVRLLAEMVWFPTAFLDDRYVTWTAMDEKRARAALRVNGRVAEGVFEFGEDELPEVFRAERYRDLGGGRSDLTPFSGECTDYREAGGMLVPYRMTACWHVGGRRVPYACFLVEALEYDI